MFTKKTSTNESTAIDFALDTALIALADLTVGTDEYAKALDHVVKLADTKEPTQEPKKKLSPDVVLTAAVNLTGIIMILHYEQVHVVASKALGFVTKLKL